MFGWFVAGGLPMVPVMIVGVLAVVAGVRHATAPSASGARAGETLRIATLALAVAGLGFDAAVAAGAASAADTTLQGATWMAGIGEALSPLVLGSALAGIGALCSSVGDLRAPPRVPA